MPFLDDEQVTDLLRLATAFSGAYWRMPACDCHVAKDYCRSCDEFYWVHTPDCRQREHKHDGHRLTIVPFVEEALQPYIVCPRCGMVSHNRNDVRERYCGNCHAYHDQLFRPAEWLTR